MNNALAPIMERGCRMMPEQLPNETVLMAEAERHREKPSTAQDKLVTPSSGGLFANPENLVQTIRKHRAAGQKRLIDVRTCFGLDVILVPVPKKKKAPEISGWPNFGSELMKDEAHLTRLESGNIAILTGEASGGLISVDLDDDDRAEEFRRLNSDLCQKTIRTRGARGCNYWFRISGIFPKGPQKFYDASGRGIGELRAGRCITVVDGEHPDGIKYSRDGRSVVSCTFGDIQWPAEWGLPWAPDPMAKLVEKEGHPILVGEGGRLLINEPAIVEKFAQEHVILHDPGLGFYEYEQLTGIWEPRTKAVVADSFSKDFKALSDECEKPELLHKRNKNLLHSLTDQLAGRVEKRYAFHQRPEGVIHVSNGMLRVTPEKVELENYSPSFMSLGRIPFPYKPDAECPDFLNNLLRRALPENDILLLQKYAGQVLLGTNLSQTFLIMEGEGGTGKGQIGAVIDHIIGTRNVSELRTSHLSGRFETRAFLGKNLLVGRDVPGDFLNQKGAATIKKLTGGDLMSVESKGKDDRSEIEGNFNIIVTANSRLVVAVEGDTSAWARRLLIIPFERRPVSKPIPNFGRTLVQNEAEGILMWMVQGAQLLLQDLQEFGRISLDGIQKNRIGDLLAESDSVRNFVTRRVVMERGGRVHTSELIEAFDDFCRNNDLLPISNGAFQRRIRSEMQTAHQAVSSENIERWGRRGRGYLGVRLLGDNEPDAQSAS